MYRGQSRGSLVAGWRKKLMAFTESVRARWPEGPIGYVQRWRRSLAQHQGIRYWLLVQGPIVLFFLGALFVLNGFIIGWRNAYDVTVQITSPWDDKVIGQPWVALPLALTGWLVWPSMTGAVVGFVLTAPAKGRRRAGSGSSLIPRLDGNTEEVPEHFARYFEELHRGHRKRAESHWEQTVERFLATDVVSQHAHSQRKMEQAVAATIAFLFAMPDRRCPICPRTADRDGRP